MREGVSGLGIERDGAGNEVLVLHVSTSDPGVLASLPRELEGYPVRIESSGPFRKQDPPEAFDAEGARRPGT